MYVVLIAAVLAVAAGFAALTAAIVVAKLWQDRRLAARRRRRRMLEPRVQQFLDGDAGSLVAILGFRPGGLDGEVVESILLDHVERPEGRRRQRVTRGAEELGLIERALAQLRSPSWWRRASAAERLGRAGARRSVEGLARAMYDEHPEVRLRAAWALSEVDGSAALRPLVLALDDPSRWSTIRIADILATRPADAPAELQAAYPELDRHGRLAAIDLLGTIRAPAAAGWLRERLGDPDPDVRSRAADALGRLGLPESAPSLLRALEDEAWPVRAMAAKAMGTLGHRPAIGALCSALRDPAWWVRSNAAHALGAMGRAGLDALERMLDDRDRFAGHQAVAMLEQAGVVDAAADRLGSAEPGERAAAERLCRLLVRAGQTGRLRELAGGHADPRVREALRGLLPPAAEEIPA